MDFRRMCSEVELLSEDTCWIFGAGASFDCVADGIPCLPLTKDIIRRDELSNEVVSDLNRLIDGGYISASTLEEAISVQAELTFDELRSAGEVDQLTRIIADRVLGTLIKSIGMTLTLSQLDLWMLHDPDEGGPLQFSYPAYNYLWVAICCSMLPRWSVITLNYDDVFDYGCRALIDQRLQPFPQLYLNWLSLINSQDIPRMGNYVKLHGSLGLYECLNRNCRKFRVPSEGSDSWKPGGNNTLTISRIATRSCKLCGQEMAHLLLPPGKNKSPQEGSFLEIAYNAATASLTEADSWVFVGYSFPEYDYDTISLIKRAIEERSRANTPPPSIHIIAPHADIIASRVGETLEAKVEAKNSTFSQLISELQKSSDFPGFPPGGMPFIAKT